MGNLFSKLGISFGVALAVNEAVNLQPLWTALITLAVSVVTVLSVEGVAWLRAWLKSKTAKSKAEEKDYSKKCEEADEVCQISDAENKKED